jgi:phytoene/squalene synthetase
MPTALNDLLKATSRSFYLPLRVLPARVRPQIGLVKRIGLVRGGGLKF